MGGPERAVSEAQRRAGHRGNRRSSSRWLSPTRYGEALFMNSKLIGGVTEFLNTERELQEVRPRLLPRSPTPLK